MYRSPKKSVEVIDSMRAKQVQIKNEKKQAQTNALRQIQPTQQQQQRAQFSPKREIQNDADAMSSVSENETEISKTDELLFSVLANPKKVDLNRLQPLNSNQKMPSRKVPRGVSKLPHDETIAVHGDGTGKSGGGAAAAAASRSKQVPPNQRPLQQSSAQPSQQRPKIGSNNGANERLNNGNGGGDCDEVEDVNEYNDGGNEEEEDFDEEDFDEDDCDHLDEEGGLEGDDDVKELGNRMRNTTSNGGDGSNLGNFSADVDKQIHIQSNGENDGAVAENTDQHGGQQENGDTAIGNGDEVSEDFLNCFPDNPTAGATSNSSPRTDSTPPHKPIGKCPPGMTREHYEEMRELFFQVKEQIKLFGATFTKEFDIYDDPSDIRYELERNQMIHDKTTQIKDISDGIKFAGGVINLANTTFGPLLSLDGFVDNWEKAVDKNQPAIVAIQRQYCKKGRSNPIMSLIFGLVGALVMTHAKNKYGPSVFGKLATLVPGIEKYAGVPNSSATAAGAAATPPTPPQQNQYNQNMGAQDWQQYHQQQQQQQQQGGPFSMFNNYSQHPSPFHFHQSPGNMFTPPQMNSNFMQQNPFTPYNTAPPPTQQPSWAPPSMGNSHSMPFADNAGVFGVNTLDPYGGGGTQNSTSFYNPYLQQQQQQPAQTQNQQQQQQQQQPQQQQTQQQTSETPKKIRKPIKPYVSVDVMSTQ
jgi:hypothetical protein